MSSIKRKKSFDLRLLACPDERANRAERNYQSRLVLAIRSKQHSFGDLITNAGAPRS